MIGINCDCFIGDALIFQKSIVAISGRGILAIGLLGILIGMSVYVFKDAFFEIITQPKKVAWKLIKTIGVMLGCVGLGVLAIYITGGKGEKTLTTVLGFSAFGWISYIWKQQKSVRVECPQCGKGLYGATEEMSGAIGVCKKCKAEFIIGEKVHTQKTNENNNQKDSY